MTIASSDKRQAVLALLARYQPIDKADEQQRNEIVAFVNANENCFERTNLAGHLTGSAWVVDKTGTNVLLTHHKKLGKWLQLGGHADGNPDILSVAMREAEEESGIKDLRAITEEIFDLDVHPIPARPNEPTHVHYDIRFVVQAASKEFVTSDESNKLAWVDIDRLSTVSNEATLLRMGRKWKRMARLKGLL